MAKRKNKSEGPSKSDLIRGILTKEPKTSVKEVVATLKQQGVVVTANLVYLIKSKMKHKKQRQKRQKAAETTRNAGIVNPIDLIIRVKQLAGEAGGMTNLKKLVDVLAE